MCLGCVSNWLPVLALVTSIVSWPLVMYEACISNGLIHSTNGLATKLCVWQPQQAVAWSAEEQRWSIGCIDKKTTLAIACPTWQVMRDTCFRSNGTPAQTRQAEEESRTADQDDALGHAHRATAKSVQPQDSSEFGPGVSEVHLGSGEPPDA